MARLYLTGGLRIEGPDGTIGGADLPGHQGRVAFVALAVERHPISHDGLADIIWDNAPPRQWKSALAAVVSKTRSLITTTGLDGTSVLSSAGGTYTFTPPAEMWIDLEHAYRCLDRAEGALRHGDHTGAVGDATVASAILRRPLLAGESCRGSIGHAVTRPTRCIAASSRSPLPGTRSATTNSLPSPPSPPSRSTRIASSATAS